MIFMKRFGFDSVKDGQSLFGVKEECYEGALSALLFDRLEEGSALSCHTHEIDFLQYFIL